MSNTWFSNEDGLRGQIVAGLLADFAVLSEDYFSVPLEEVKDLASILTVVAGKIVYGAREFKSLSPEIPAAMPDWSPVRTYGGYQERIGASQHVLAKLQNAFSSACCGLHLQKKQVRNSLEEVALDWSMGCSCWAF